MLVELSIRNLAIIEYATISCRNGFHVLTGETGAGKSIVIDALSLIAGGRASSDLVRYGAEKTEVEALFELDRFHPVWEELANFGIESEDESLIIRREVTAQGKSLSRINGQLVNLSSLKEIGEWLVNIHGQHEHQSLLKVERHLQWLDLYGEETISPVKNNYQEAYFQYNRYAGELRELEEKSRHAVLMQEMYRFQAEEIASAQLQPGEDELLPEEKRKLANAEKRLQSASEAYDFLYANEKTLDLVSKALQRVEELAVFDKTELLPLMEQIQSAYYQLEDAAYQLREYRDRIEYNPERLEQIEQRMDILAAFRRKYGETVQDMLDYLRKIEGELSLIEQKDERMQQLTEMADKERKSMEVHAAELSELRQTVARKLAQEIEEELHGLQMKQIRFHVQVEPKADKFTQHGVDQVEFLIAPNPGEPPRSLHKIASGGELSRIMLAMKTIFARMDRIPVLVFDEVDTGVSGRAAQAIAEKMSALSRHCQVFAITHLPQVACMADVHYATDKAVDGNRTFTVVHDLTEGKRVIELARMLGGVEVTETTREHAQEMLELAEKMKAKH